MIRNNRFCIINFLILIIFIITIAWQTASAENVFPGKTWTTKTPEEMGLDPSFLASMAKYMGGRGFVAYHGYQVFTWGNYKKAEDVASAAKPFYSFFLWKALQDHRIPSMDQPVYKWVPALATINADLGYKDKKITWRHFANQISCYGLVEQPGSAFDYNDWQMALFWDTLFTKVYGATWKDVDEKVFHPLLTDLIQCEDHPTMMAFGTKDRPGRTAVSPRDFARFGTLFLHQGSWRGTQLLKPDFAHRAVTEPLPSVLPRAGHKAAEMLPDQRSIGSRQIPDNQCEHKGCYSWLWWINGIDREGTRRWPDAPTDVFTALGHRNGMRGMAVMPSQGIVISWNDSRIGDLPEEPHPLNEMFRLMMAALQTK